MKTSDLPKIQLNPRRLVSVKWEVINGGTFTLGMGDSLDVRRRVNYALRWLIVDV